MARQSKVGKRSRGHRRLRLPEAAALPEVGKHLATRNVLKNHVQIRVVLWDREADGTRETRRRETRATGRQAATTQSQVLRCT